MGVPRPFVPELFLKLHARLKCHCEQCDESANLHCHLNAGIRFFPIQRTGCQTGLLVDELGNARIHGLCRNDAPRGYWEFLPDAVNAIDGLGLLGTRPGKFSQDHVRGGLEVHSHTRGKEGTHDDLDSVIVGKSIDGALALRRALVASNGGGGDSHRSK